ncbi:MAG: MutS-related protein, partial [Pirellulaceae bacterium]
MGKAIGQPANSGDRIAWYDAKIQEFDAEIASALALWRKLSVVRGLTFLAALALLISGIVTAAGIRNAWFVLSAIVFVVFLYIAVVHEGLESALRKKKVWRRLYRWSRARLQRDWDKLRQIDVKFDPAYGALVNDLDLFGRSSLFQLVGGVETPLGIELFRDWLLIVPTADEVNQRQAAIQELQQRPDFRDRLRFSCHLLSAGDGGPETLTKWCEAPVEYDRRGLLIWIARILAGITAFGVIGLLTGWIPITIAGPGLLGMLAINFFMTVIFAGRIHAVFNQVSSRHHEVSHYDEVFRLIRGESLESPMLQQLKQELFTEHGDVLEATRSLGLISWCANLRRHGVLFFIYLLLQFGFLWDFHVIRQLHRWKEEHGSHVRRWFEVLGQWEVLASLSQFAEDHGEWVYPEMKNQPKATTTIVAKSLGHPLLHHELRVDNDVQIGPCGSVLLVTGSNMSGKSTLLRAIGLNTVLAHLGAPVCAVSMNLSPMRIETSMRIQDSLADGVSFFMAELRRLKQVVDIARQYENRDDVTVLFLLDEILQGTNSRERHIA